MVSTVMIREIVFFLMVFFLFFLFNKGMVYLGGKINMNSDVKLIITSLIYTGVIIGLYYLAKMKSNVDGYRMLDISPGALCSGGPYMWDQDRADFCTKLASTPEGKCQIASFNCPSGLYHGQPRTPFMFSNLSNDQWKNERCEPNPPLRCGDNCMTSNVGWQKNFNI